MPWISAALTISAARVEAFSDALLEAGAISVDVTDAHAGTPAERPVFGEPGESNPGEWELSTVSALFAEQADVAAKVAAALQCAGLDPAQAPDFQRIADQDWVRATQNQFQPVHVSQRLWVVPTWHEPPVPAAINLLIDPGLAFGTGTHPTTRMCLAWLDANLRAGESVLDYGCGSGILAIAAMKLGAGRASGVDIDPAAMLAARHNAMQNEVMVEFIAAAGAAPQPADIVLANILANPLIVLAPLLAQATRPGGRLVLSGVLDHQASAVEDAYRPWFDMHPAGQDGGWALLSGSKR